MTPGHRYTPRDKELMEPERLVVGGNVECRGIEGEVRRGQGEGCVSTGFSQCGVWEALTQPNGKKVTISLHCSEATHSITRTTTLVN